jgi:ribosomal protein S18 acetylase RimI-like enzyme
MPGERPSALRIVPVDPAGEAPVAARLHAIQIAAYAVEAALIDNEAIPPLHESVDDLRRRPFDWLAALDGEQIIGAIALQPRADVVDIHRLIVDPAAFRRGAGSALIQAVLDQAGARPVFVATGAANAPARRLYERLGFTLTREREAAPGLLIAEFRFTPPTS